MFTTRENRRAATIINKAIDQSSNILNGVVLAQNSVSEKKMTLQDVLTEYAGFVIGVSFVIIFVLLLLLYSLSVSRKKQMEALKEAQDANAANIAKTTFLNHMSVSYTHLDVYKRQAWNHTPACQMVCKRCRNQKNVSDRIAY